ncbi:MAG: serine dehydratase [Planctomycetia bacterium]|nr:serine dehydratase [Planctomycetia bacterium]
MLVSIFNDVLGPVMRGPSSSHCAAALRIGRLARDLLGGDVRDVLVEFDRAGSLPTTHDSQGSDMGLFGGLLGWDAADERLPGSLRAFVNGGGRYRIETVDAGDPHPNTYRLTVANDRERHTLRAISTGGGMIEVIDIDGATVSLHGDWTETLVWIRSGETAAAAAAQVMRQIRATMRRIRGAEPEAIGLENVFVHVARNATIVQVTACAPLPAVIIDRLIGDGLASHVRVLQPVLPVRSCPGMSVPFRSCAEMLAHDAGRGTPLWRLAVEYERLRGGLTEEDVLKMMRNIVGILRRSIAAGLAGTTYDDRVLPAQSPAYAAALQAGRLLDAGALNKAVAAVAALMEVKSSMGVIVAMPTAGACAALPGAVIAMAEAMGLGEEEMARAFLASGLIGVFIATTFSFAAEVGGCQAEGGSAAAMAAAALVTLAGGTLEQSLAAASLALQSMIGLICDPVANRVEAPCLGKNVMAAANAVCCANMALAGFDPLIPLDEVIETAKRVAGQMPREVRCTALGGLSITPTSLAIQSRLEAGAAARACGTGGCGCG